MESFHKVIPILYPLKHSKCTHTVSGNATPVPESDKHSSTCSGGLMATLLVTARSHSQWEHLLTGKRRNNTVSSHRLSHAVGANAAQLYANQGKPQKHSVRRKIPSGDCTEHNAIDMTSKVPTKEKRNKKRKCRIH